MPLYSTSSPWKRWKANAEIWDNGLTWPDLSRTYPDSPEDFPRIFRLDLNPKIPWSDGKLGEEIFFHSFPPQFLTSFFSPSSSSSSSSFSSSSSPSSPRRVSTKQWILTYIVWFTYHRCSGLVPHLLLTSSSPPHLPCFVWFAYLSCFHLIPHLFCLVAYLISLLLSLDSSPPLLCWPLLTSLWFSSHHESDEFDTKQSLIKTNQDATFSIHSLIDQW